MHIDSFFHEETITLSLDHSAVEERKVNADTSGPALEPCPLKRWTSTVSGMTHLEKNPHLKEPYIALVEKLRKQEIDTESDRYEFLKAHPRCGDPANSCC